MLATIYLLATLLQPAPAPVAVPAGQPAIEIARPAWAFEPMPIADEPTLPCLLDWVAWADDERVWALMVSVMPFDAVADSADPFDGEGGL